MIEFALAAVPLLLLLASLLGGRYPGHETAMRLAGRFACAARTRIPAAADWRHPRLPLARSVHGGLLLAFGLSGRAPPA
jgi:hypothetical protein